MGKEVGSRSLLSVGSGVEADDGGAAGLTRFFVFLAAGRPTGFRADFVARLARPAIFDLLALFAGRPFFFATFVLVAARFAFPTGRFDLLFFLAMIILLLAV